MSSTTTQTTLRHPILPLTLAVVLVLLLLSGCSSSSSRSVTGVVTDAITGNPVAGAFVQVAGPSGNVSATTGEDGRYAFDDLTADARVVVKAVSYKEAQFTVGNGGEVTTALEPLTLGGLVSDAYTGQPIAGAKVSQGDLEAQTDASGRYELTHVVTGQAVSITAPGYAATETVAGDSGILDASLRPDTLAGVITSAADGQPIAGATVSLGDKAVTTDESGEYQIGGVPETGTLIVRAGGYETAEIELDRKTTLDVELEPFVVRGAYLTYYGVGDEGLRENVFRLIDETELNAVVIDIKGDFGKLAYKSAVPLAEAIGANDEQTIPDIKALLSRLKEKGVYTIARIVVFKDDKLGRNGPDVGLDVAVKDAATGGLWIDGENLAWVDPFRTEVWDYNIALAVEAAENGFDEIQFDYIRFPTDPSAGTSVGAAMFSQPSTEANRTAAIEGFLARAQDALRPTGAALSVDVFGYTCWREDDMGIGQNIEAIAKHVDFISPMVYPSTYDHGLPMEPSYLDAPAYPYEIVYYSVKRAVDRLAGLPVKVRPWLQYFDDYPWKSGRSYDAPQIIAQKEANVDAGGVGYLLWDPTNRFSRGGLEAE